MNRRVVSQLVAVAVALTGSTSIAAAQGGSISGTITGEDHKPLYAAHAQIESPARATTTNAKGKFDLRDLPAGKYEVLITALGYEPQRKSIEVGAGQKANIDVDLKPGALLLSSVVTTATRTPTLARHVAATVNVLTPELVKTSPSRESQDMLREIPAVELKRQSSLIDGSAQIVSMRGVDEGRTVVLADGIPLGDAWGEWIDWGRLPKGMVDRVEVVEGGTSNLYGNGAMGGVISFFTRPWAPNTGTLTVDGGSRDAQHIFGAAGIPLVGALTANVALDYTAGGGYRLIDSTAENPSLRPGPVDAINESIQRNGFVRLNYAPSAKWSAFATAHMFGDNRNTGTALARTSRELKQLDLGITHGELASGQIALRAWNGQHNEHQRASTIRTNSSACTENVPRACEDSSLTADIPSHDAGASLVWSKSNIFKLESFTVGGDYRRMTGNFDETDYNTTCPGANCGVVTRTISSGGDQALSGVFLQAIAAPLPRTHLEIGMRGDRWDNTNARAIDATGTHEYPEGSRNSFSPRIGLQYDVPVPASIGSLSFHAAYYNAFRAPNLAELYRKQISATSITLPNPELKPEYALGREVGLAWQPMTMLQIKGTYYVADYKDFNIPFTLAASGSPDRPAECGTVATCRQRRNISRARSTGAEGYIGIRPIAGLFVSAGVSYDDTRQLTNLPAGTPKDKRPHVNRVPSPRQTVRAMYSSEMLGTWTVLWKHEGINTTLQGLPLDPFTTWDINAQREIIPGVLGFISVENLTDEKFMVNKSVSGSGASAVTTLQYGMPRTVRAGVTLTYN